MNAVEVKAREILPSLLALLSLLSQLPEWEFRT
jgi:hypothetical protein